MRLPGFGGDPVRAGRRRSSRATSLGRVTDRSGALRECRSGPGPQERGSAAAEFAVAIPAAVLVLGCCLGAIQVASQQVRLTDAAADAARTLARGDPLGVATERVHRIDASAALNTTTAGDFVCVQLSAPAGFGPAAIAGVRVRASGCALAGGL
ncbi:TadE family type IV pilus minor pilin [Mycetocola sp. 2940]|uniref:TadE family type IV pilus minor pilin n=1 Tax=Mycetocola sp. 2940 TaxID=3156452 RepID=UPI0033917171